MKIISKNIRHLRKLHSLTQEQLANQLEITRSRVGAYEEGRSEPPIATLILLSDYFQLPVDILVKNNLTHAQDKSFIEIGNKRVLFPIIIDTNDADLIEVIPAKASAGYLNGYADPEYVENLQMMKLPFLPTGKHRAFPIKGDSMLPIKDGSIVVGKFVESLGQLKNGKTYVLITKTEGIVYKRIYSQIDEDQALLLISDNKMYSPYRVFAKDILEIWEFTCCINLEEYDEKELNYDSIMTMLREMKVELQTLKEKKN